LSTDWYSKLVLTVIAVCLAVLVLQGQREGAASLDEGRYRLTFVPMARMMFRVDSQTGKTSKALFPDVKIWTPVADSPAELLDAVAELPGPTAPEAAAPEAPEDAVTP
jgi:hypothetical protein